MRFISGLFTAFYLLVSSFDRSSQENVLDANAKWETWKCRGWGPRKIEGPLYSSFCSLLLPHRSHPRVLRVLFSFRVREAVLWTVYFRRVRFTHNNTTQEYNINIVIWKANRWTSNIRISNEILLQVDSFSSATIRFYGNPFQFFDIFVIFGNLV